VNRYQSAAPAIPSEPNGAARDRKGCDIHSLPGLPAARSQAVDGVKQIAVTKLNFEEGVVSPQLGSRARANTRFWEV